MTVTKENILKNVDKIEVESVQDFNRSARKYCMNQNQHTNACRGRTDGPTYACWSTPVEVIADSDSAPKVRGFGYWKTTFNNGAGFSRTLYTPSTFHIVVGENWKD